MAAINGFCLGGGCELVLACDYRIASHSLKIGLPETRLGIIPGWGGTVRLPRIAGFETAVEWIAGGQQYRAEAAMKVGVIDGLVADEHLYTAALAGLERCITGDLPYKERRQQKQQAMQHTPLEATMAFATSKAFVAHRQVIIILHRLPQLR